MCMRARHLQVLCRFDRTGSASRRPGDASRPAIRSTDTAAERCATGAKAAVPRRQPPELHGAEEALFCRIDSRSSEVSPDKWNEHRIRTSLCMHGPGRAKCTGWCGRQGESLYAPHWSSVAGNDSTGHCSQEQCGRGSLAIDRRSSPYGRRRPDSEPHDHAARVSCRRRRNAGAASLKSSTNRIGIPENRQVQAVQILHTSASSKPRFKLMEL